MKTNLKSKLKWGTGLMLVTAVFALPLMLFTGCSNNPANSTADMGSFWDQPYDPVERAPFSGTNTLLNNGGTTVNAVFDDRVSALTGGDVLFDANGEDAKFSVAPGSIPSDTTISVEPKVEKYLGDTFLTLDFGPDGLQFSSSATLTVDARAVNWDGRSRVALYWLNPLTNKWVYQTSVLPDKDGDLVYDIDHFSMYGIGKRF
ncbi:hypothetical protein GF377_10920 [candidate division GN15 bacterium]|nr:hypothetical protein [candidate division GN15 bacterium]